MYWNDETPVYIYGAGLIGKMIASILMKTGFKVYGYLDITAEAIKEVEGLPVYLPDQLEKKEREECIIVCSVLNVFQHEEIVQHLLELGYQFIVFKNMKDDLEKENNILYDLISLYAVDPTFDNYECLHNEIINKPVNKIDISKRKKTARSNTQLNKINGYITVEIPLIFMYTKSKQVYVSLCKNEYEKDELIPKPYDSNLCYYFYCKDLYKLFDDDLDFDTVKFILKRYYDYFSKFNTYSIDSIEEKFKAHLQQRYNIYLYMNEMLYENPVFFRNNAPILRWDDKKNYLYLIDGANRCAFLKQKGYRKFACRMSNDDYNKWVNRIKLNQCIEEMGEKSSIVVDSDDSIIDTYMKVLLGEEQDFLLKKEMAVLEYLGNIMFFEEHHICIFFSDEVVMHNVFDKMEQQVWICQNSVESEKIYSKKAEILYMNKYEFVSSKEISDADFIYISVEKTKQNLKTLNGIQDKKEGKKLLVQEIEEKDLAEAKSYLQQMGWQIIKILYFFSQKEIAVIIADFGGIYD